MPESFSNALAVSLSSMIGTSLTLISIYGALNMLTALFNVILIPIFSVIFMLIFAFSFLSSIIPVISIINTLPNAVLNLYNFFVDLFAKINSIVSLNNVGSICLVLFIVFIFIAGNFCILKLKPKIICSVIVLVFCVTSAIFNILPQTYNTNSLITIRSKYDNCYLLTTTENNRVLIVNTLNGYSLNTISAYISRHNITKLDAVLTNKVELSSEEENKFISQLNCEIINLTNYFYEYEAKHLCNMKISVTSQTSMKKCFVISVDSKNILFCFKKLNMAEQEDLQLNFDNFYAVICKDNTYTNFESKKITYYDDDEENVICSSNQNFFTLKI